MNDTTQPAPFVGDRAELEHVRYFRTATGSVGEVAESAPGISSLPADAVEITVEEYRRVRHGLEASTEQLLADLEAADGERMRGDYEALLAAGIPAGTASRLTGYTAPEG
ncbi:hypothetical protein [Streptosporangium sp. NPDC002721]|uniref:hypothetical protein n=1 Tax=Streptosporangium sp. NPDC002721 TaxID=3366188 RepID=UPI0036BFDA93